MENNIARVVGQEAISNKRNFGLPRNGIKILVMLVITITAYTGAIAQAKNKCVKDEKKVCKPTADGKGTSCYETKNAQNYKVCKGNAGYYVCCHTPAEATAYSIHAIDNSYNIYDVAFPEGNNRATTAATTTSGEDNAMEEPSGNGGQENKVCKKASNGTTACYKTEYAKNYKVCKDDLGYHVCGTVPRP